MNLTREQDKANGGPEIRAEKRRIKKAKETLYILRKHNILPLTYENPKHADNPQSWRRVLSARGKRGKWRG